MKKKPGRKPTNKPKKRRVNICLSDKAIVRLAALAKVTTGGSASAWIENQIMKQRGA